MSRRNGTDDPSRPAFNAPFRELRKLVGEVPPKAVRKPPQRAPRTPASPSPPEVDDEALFRAATAGAVPIPPEDRNRIDGPPPLHAPSPTEREHAEALAELSDLVSGNGAFDVSDTEEHVEGIVVGVDPRIVHRLRAGDFSYQAHLDLHGLTADEAKDAVRAFILRALRAGHRCVLLIHGRGLNSRDQRPVLKDGLKTWLTRGELARVVLAFSTARSCDGGAGAMYVLLRRERRNKKPFRTLTGAKS